MKSIAAQLEAIAKRSQEDLEDVFSASMLRLGNITIQASPVDTGRFRSNWMSAYGAIDSKTVPDALPSGAPSVTRLTSKLADVDLGVTFYFTNSLPYAQRLEYGWSAQAKGGIVRKAKLEWERIVKEEVNKRA